MQASTSKDDVANANKSLQGTSFRLTIDFHDPFPLERENKNKQTFYSNKNFI